ncbi:hypothetical protein GOBAR_AA27793 [Gossypium barbadense]|uniref:Uncharacterized protein n=1 Tax=Gossypium barbadense TaxID=3634 RepID=A0A2P5WPC5_GOSBA|nr:hypothetical protein GOBAR_AA27793 [Gossypium barbadense]
MSHGRGDLSHPVFWGNHVLLQDGHIVWSCLFPYLATAVGTLVCLAVCAEKLCNSKTKLIDSKRENTKLGMTHLNRIEWENAEYRKRDFLIWCGSDNVGICGIQFLTPR